MDKTLWIIIVVFGILIIGAVTMVANQNKKLNQNQNLNVEEDVQVIDLGFKGYNYYPDTITVESNRQVMIVANTNQIQGCYRSFTIPNLNIKKLITPTDNKIIFTPTQPGTYEFRCSMGMGRGKLIVQ